MLSLDGLYNSRDFKVVRMQNTESDSKRSREHRDASEIEYSSRDANGRSYKSD